MRAGRAERYERDNTDRGFSMLAALFIVFLILKLTPPVQDWSWWWVTSPLWLPVAAAVVIVLVKVVQS